MATVGTRVIGITLIGGMVLFMAVAITPTHQTTNPDTQSGQSSRAGKSSQPEETTLSPEELADLIKSGGVEFDKTVRAHLPHPASGRFRNVMAMAPSSGPKGAWVYCGEVDVISRTYEDEGYIRFFGEGQTVDFIRDGSIYERAFNKYCLDATPITPVDFD